MLTQERGSFKCRNYQFGEQQVKRCWRNLLSRHRTGLDSFHGERMMYLLNKGLIFPIVFVQVVSDIGLSCRVEWKERGSGLCIKSILDVKVSSYRGHMSLISAACRVLQLETEWMCVMKKQYFAQSSLTSEQYTKSGLFAEWELLFYFSSWDSHRLKTLGVSIGRAGKGRAFPCCPCHLGRRFGVGFFSFKLFLRVRKEDKRGVWFFAAEGQSIHFLPALIVLNPTWARRW